MSHEFTQFTDWNTDNLTLADIAVMEDRLEAVADQQSNYQKPLGRRYSVGDVPAPSPAQDET